MNQHQRGQAVVEGVLCMLFMMLPALALLYYTGTVAVVTERLAATSRYRQEVLNNTNVFTQYSLPAVYQAIAPSPESAWHQAKCVDTPTNFLTKPDGKLYKGLNFERSNYWAVRTVTLTESCDPANPVLSHAFTDGAGRLSLLLDYAPAQKIDADMGQTFLRQLYQSSNVHWQQTGNYMTAAGVGQIVRCYQTDKSSDSDPGLIFEEVLTQTLVHASKGLGDPDPSFDQYNNPAAVYANTKGGPVSDHVMWPIIRPGVARCG